MTEARLERILITTKSLTSEVTSCGYCVKDLDVLELSVTQTSYGQRIQSRGIIDIFLAQDYHDVINIITSRTISSLIFYHL